MRRVNYFSHFIPEDYHLLVKNYGLKAKLIAFNYASIQNIVTDDCWVRSDNILLGNSAAETNNHYEAIDFIVDKIEPHQKVFCPLSYAGSQEYIEKVIEYGKKRLGSSFYPLTDFLSKEEYNDILSTCGIILMYHLRSQAAGNIVAALYQGSHVYMHSQNTLYNLLQKIGIKITSVNHAGGKKLTTLSETEKLNNRTKITKFFSQEKVLERYKNLLLNKL